MTVSLNTQIKIESTLLATTCKQEKIKIPSNTLVWCRTDSTDLIGTARVLKVMEWDQGGGQ